MSGNIKRGDPVEYRDASGEWHRSIARSTPHFNDHDCARGVKPWMVVRLDWGDEVVNWPAVDVRHVEPRRAVLRTVVRMESF